MPWTGLRFQGGLFDLAIFFLVRGDPSGRADRMRRADRLRRADRMRRAPS